MGELDSRDKIAPSMMLGSRMGSHFTNDDLVKESRIIEADLVGEHALQSVGQHNTSMA